MPLQRRLFTVGLLGLGANAMAAAPKAKEVPQPDYVIEAVAMRVYGPFWQWQIASSGHARYRYTSNSGRIMTESNLLLVPEDVQALLQTDALKKLADLPAAADARPVPFHMPEFSIRIRSGTNRRAVDIYDPKSLPPSPELENFWAAWNAIWALMPQWKIAPQGADDVLPPRQSAPSPP